MGELDFGSTEASASVTVYSPALTTGMVMVTIVVFFIVIAGSVHLALRGSPPRSRWTIHDLPSSQRLLLVLSVSTTMVVQAIGATTAFVQTHVVHESTLEYFQYLSHVRLLGTSHAHIFGFLVLYGIIGIAISLSSGNERLKCFVIATMLWAGIFDVLSWWGIKELSPRFEWLSIITGASTVLCSWIAIVLVVRDLVTRSQTA